MRWRRCFWWLRSPAAFHFGLLLPAGLRICVLWLGSVQSENTGIKTPLKSRGWFAVEPPAAETTDLWDVKVKVQSFSRQLLRGVVKYASERNFWRATGLCAVGALNVVWNNQTCRARNHQLENVLGLLPVWALGKKSPYYYKGCVVKWHVSAEYKWTFPLSGGWFNSYSLQLCTQSLKLFVFCTVLNNK